MTELDEQKVLEWLVVESLTRQGINPQDSREVFGFVVVVTTDNVRAVIRALHLAVGRMDDLTVQAQEQEADANV